MHIFFQSLYNFIDASSKCLWKIIQNGRRRSLQESILRKTFCGGDSSSSVGYSKLKIPNYFFNLLFFTVLDRSLSIKNFFLTKWWPVKLRRPIFDQKITRFLLIKEKYVIYFLYYTFIYFIYFPDVTLQEYAKIQKSIFWKFWLRLTP